MVAQAVGGPPWTLVGVITFVLVAFTRPGLPLLALAAPSLVWLVLARVTENRELFFPYAMHLAAVVACRLANRTAVWGFLGGAAVVAAFLGIRVAQEATLRVLAVECAVAVAILGGVTIARHRSSRQPAVDAAIIIAAAISAYAGLAL